MKKEDNSRMDHHADWSKDSSVHIFFYAWYANPETDGEYHHWNHVVLPHWTKEVNSRYRNINKPFDPRNDDIGSNFYPLRGTYSSRDRNVIIDQFKSLKKVNVQTVVMSFWGHANSDENGKFYADLLDLYFEIAEEVGMKIAIHLEPYKGRNAESIVSDIQYLNDKFGSYHSFYKVNGKYLKYSSNEDIEVPLIYVYDSYLLKEKEWKKILDPKGSLSIRGTDNDAVFISLFLNPSQSNSLIVNGKFDGFYTYFAAEGFTHGSTPKNWKHMNSFAKENDLIFIPSVGPGYDDTRIRPWNSINRKDRKNGTYYKRMWEKAMKLETPFISITSYNEWHEGTQIEESIPRKNKDLTFNYDDFRPNRPSFYMDLTKKYIDDYVKNKK